MSDSVMFISIIFRVTQQLLGDKKVRVRFKSILNWKKRKKRDYVETTESDLSSKLLLNIEKVEPVIEENRKRSFFLRMNKKVQPILWSYPILI